MNDFIFYVQEYANNFVLYTVALLFCICFVVFVHEAGHYLTARLFGVRIKKFSLGFGREIWGFSGKNNTRYALSLIPLGGYVDLFGYSSSSDPKIWDEEKQEARDYTDAERGEAFFNKPLWQRTLIVLMGPLANFILAVLILAALYMVQGQGSTKPVIFGVAKGTAAYEARLKPLDEILLFDGKKLKRFEDIWEKSWTPNTKMVWTIKRGDEIFDVELTSRETSYIDKKGIPRSNGRVGATNFPGIFLKDILAVEGIRTEGDEEKLRKLLPDYMDREIEVELNFPFSRIEVFIIHPISEMNEGMNDPDDVAYESLMIKRDTDSFFVRHNVFNALWYAGGNVYKFIDESLKFLHVALFKKPGEEKIGGLVTMGKTTGKALNSGWYTFFMLIAVFSVQIGFINLLPIPVLDGGYLLFFGYEAAAGKPLPAQVQDYALSIGIILLIGIMLIANINDIIDFANP